MRVLLASTRGAGHVGPLLPFARALLRSGADVALAVPRSAAGLGEAAGLEVLPVDVPPAAEVGAVFASLGGLSHEDRAVVVMRDVFAGYFARSALPGMRAAIAAWRPDVVLREAHEFASALAAEEAGVPDVRIGVMLEHTEHFCHAVVAAPLDALRSELGLSADPAGERLAASPYLTLAADAIEDPELPRVPGARRYREPDAPGEPLPAWWGPILDARPLVFVSFGSVAAGHGYFPALYRTAIEAIAPLPVRVLVATGREADPAELGPVPPNVHVERWVRQEAIVPHAAAVVCHGGFGTFRSTLALGVPMVVTPLFADQPVNAGRLTDLGAGIVVEPGPTVGVELRAALRRVLHEPQFRAAARRVADETRTLPLVDEAVDDLQAMIAGRVAA
jgi:UDP:flavonoid glycosyltransferase YjiC (YdhE family)